MEKKWTTGKWHVDGFNTTAVMALIPHTEGTGHPCYQHVCDCNYGHAAPEKFLELNQANARLIAAAPEMFELLVRIQSVDDYSELFALQDQIVTLLTRITKND